MSIIGKEAKKFVKSAKKLGGALLNEGKQTAYKVAAKVEKDIHLRTGVVGGIADLVDQTIAEGKKVHSNIQSQGGYEAVANKYINKFVDATVKVYDTLDKKFVTDGYFDSDKLKKEFKSAADVASVYGKKAGAVLWDLTKESATQVKAGVGKGVSNIKKEYRAYREAVPDFSDKDVKSRYAGIGTMYGRVLFKQHYEATLKFHEQATKSLPGGLKVRSELLDDIKATASANSDELVQWYVENNAFSENKIKAVQKYLRK